MDPFNLSLCLDRHTSPFDFSSGLCFALLPLESFRMLFKSLLSEHKPRFQKAEKQDKSDVGLGNDILSKTFKGCYSVLRAVAIERYLLFKL